MSILRAMYSGVSGLNAETEALGVVGDNVANANTIGFKESRAVFGDVLGAAIGGHDTVGSGVRMVRTQQIFAQGALANTGQATDVALSGEGFLVVKGNVDGNPGTFYTRNGQLTLNNDGVLTNQDGLAIQGRLADAKGNLTNSLGTIKLPTTPIPPKATGTMKVSANLDASAAVPAKPFDIADPGGTSNLSTSMTVYDSLGHPHGMDVYFNKTGSGAWEYHVVAKGSELDGAPGGMVDVASGTLNFDSTGALKSIATSGGGTVDFADAQSGQPIKLDFGSSIDGGGTGLDGLTQYASSGTISAQSQDGYASGALSGVRIDSNGVVNGVYTNGQTIAAGQLSIAKFQSTDGLGRAGHNLWTATPQSGDATLGDAGSGGRASIVSGALEQSNVDITQQFVDLIAHQRAFQANSKTITTADQMLQELMSIKQ